MTDPLGDSGAANPKLKRWSVAYQKDIFALAQSFFTIAAIIAGGWWFWFQGQPFTKANTTLTVEDRRLPGTDWTLIAITVKVENVGLRTIRLTQGTSAWARWSPCLTQYPRPYPPWPLRARHRIGKTLSCRR